MWPFKHKTRDKFLPTAEMIVEARRKPNGWAYQIDGNFGPHDSVPPEAIIGAFKVSASGELTGEFRTNPNYRGR